MCLQNELRGGSCGLCSLTVHYKGEDCRYNEVILIVFPSTEFGSTLPSPCIDVGSGQIPWPIWVLPKLELRSYWSYL